MKQTAPPRKSVAGRSGRSSRRRASGREPYVLLEASELLRVYVLPDFAAEVVHVGPGAVLLELVQHPVADAGDQEDLLVAGGVRVDRRPDLRVDAVALLLREVLRGEHLVEREVVGVGPACDDRLGGGGGEAGALEVL